MSQGPDGGGEDTSGDSASHSESDEHESEVAPEHSYSEVSSERSPSEDARTPRTDHPPAEHTAGGEESAYTSPNEREQPAYTTPNEREQPAYTSPDEREQQEGNVAGSLETYQTIEPQAIDKENAFFVLLGVAFVLGFIILGIAGL